MPSTKKLKEMILKKKEHREPLIQIPKENLLSTGFTPLNVHCTGTTKGGYGKGLFVFIVGDSSSGKTWLSHTCLAEAALNSEFDNYDFVFDNIENGALMNAKRFFGGAVAKRLQPPQGTFEDPINSVTSEDFYNNLTTRLESGKPCIYIADSETALSAVEDVKKFKENRRASGKGKEIKGTYGTGKAKTNSINMRMIVPLLKKTGSILIIISQTRQNIGWGFEDRTRSGGLSLRFYAHLEFWTKIIKKFKKDVGGKKRHIGSQVEIDIRKNRLTGWEGKLSFPFYKSYGIDEVGGCVDYLVEEGYWKKRKATIVAHDLELEGSKEDLILQIEDGGMLPGLRKAVRKCFDQIEAECSLKRKPRYS